MLKKSALLLHLISDKASPTASDSSGVARTLNRRFVLKLKTAGSSLSLSVGFSINDEDMDVARSVPLGIHNHADVIDVIPYLEN